MQTINPKAQAAHAGSKLTRCSWTWSACKSLRKLQAIFFVIFSAILVVPPAACYAAEANLHADQELSTAGYYQLSWNRDSGAAAAYILEEVREGSGIASVIYQGTDTATVISGKPDGVYHYTLRSVDGSSVSKPVTITVKHHSLATALNFFLVGAVVFIFILVAIIRGNRTRTA